MKYIVSPRETPRFIIYCPNCKCRFIYEKEDMFINSFGFEVVTCPTCREQLEHSLTHITQ